MVVPFRHGQTVVVERGGGFDEYGDPAPWVDHHTIAGCAWFPRTQGAGASTTSIDERGRTGVIEGLTLLAPFGADILDTDRIRLPNGERYDVEGELGEWRSPQTGWEPGVEVNLRRAEG